MSTLQIMPFEAREKVSEFTISSGGSYFASAQAQECPTLH